MNIKYYFKNIDSLNEASKKYVEKKIESVANLILVEQIKIEIDRRKDGVFHMSVQFDCGIDLFLAEDDDRNINACIDKIEDELKKQIRRNKKKNKDLKERGARSIKKKMTIDENARL